MSATFKKLLSYVLFVVGIALTIGGISIASKPSAMPLPTVIGAFALPALIFWWAAILYRSSNISGKEAMNTAPGNKTKFFEISIKNKKYFYTAASVAAALLIVGLAINQFIKSELDNCIESGIKAQKDDMVWKNLRQYGVGESDAAMEHRIRLQCMSAMHR
jgi:hypothetical protein